MMPTRTSLELSLPDTGQSYPPIAVPVNALAPADGLQRDLARLESNTQLHMAAMMAHERKAETFIEINIDIANRSADAFLDYARSSEARAKEAHGLLFEKDVLLVEHHFRQALFDGLSANARETARQTGMLATMSVLPLREEPEKKGFFARLFGG